MLGQQKKKLIEDRRSLLYKLSKLEVQTPVSGTVHTTLQILGRRSVLEAAKPIMYIVPNDEPDWFRFASMRRTSISSIGPRGFAQVHLL